MMKIIQQLQFQVLVLSMLAHCHVLSRKGKLLMFTPVLFLL